MRHVRRAARAGHSTHTIRARLYPRAVQACHRARRARDGCAARARCPACLDLHEYYYIDLKHSTPSS